MAAHAWRSQLMSRQLCKAVARTGLMAAKRLIAAVILAALLAWAPPLQAQEDAPESSRNRDVIRMVQDVSRALQARNAASFLRFFDRNRFDGYPALESHIVALTTQSDIASSIDITEIEPKEDGYRLRVDWLLQLSIQETPGPLESRRRMIEISASEQKKGKWRITGLTPVDFFRPQGAPLP